MRRVHDFPERLQLEPKFWVLQLVDARIANLVQDEILECFLRAAIEALLIAAASPQVVFALPVGGRRRVRNGISEVNRWCNSCRRTSR